ncbi:MAG TPA: TRAP transporter small permease subunit [Kofleriaceae bacterium]|nr:TRAP transporter small permease subunit [Kofleriaceae bacterium]
MRRLLRVSRLIDRLADAIGALTCVLTLVMVLIGAFNAVARYLDRDFKLELSSNSYIELQWYLFSIIFLLGATYALRRGAHVRVDVFYGRLSRRGKAWLDLAGGILFLVPTCIAAAWLSWPAARHSWQIREQSPDPGGLPRYPIKLLVVLAFALLLLQAISEIIKRAAVLAGHEVDDGPRAAPPAGGGEA